ncbi:MAG TPA: GvpL/GvpF family gas vesicle protein [Thermoanaerobaculia bacterium]|nr:GvpL/GvpF family gas vesicle protein [Thermoanaerobaculia bacterium]
MEGERHLLLGAHLREEDARLDGVARLAAGDLVLSALACGARRSPADREIIARAAAARAELAAREIFVAIRWGASATSPADAEEKCRAHLPRWRELLERWRGCAELTFKAGGAAARERPDRSSFTSGADYLRALQTLRNAGRVDPRLLDAAESRFATLAERTRRVRREDGGAEIAMLVRREKIDAAADLALALRADFPTIPFLLSGPWPLEVFADEP